MARPESSSSCASAQGNTAAVYHQLKKHKVLPHPQQNDRLGDVRQRTPRISQSFVNATTSAPLIYDLHQLSSLSDLKHELRRTATGPHLPPTPPIQSHASSSKHSSWHSVTSARTTSPTSDDGGVPLVSPATIQRPLATPPDQRSPPTPDVTPPQMASVVVEGRIHQSFASGVNLQPKIGSTDETYRAMRHRGLDNDLRKDESDNQLIEDKMVANPSIAPQAARLMHPREMAALTPPSPERSSFQKPRHTPCAPLHSTKSEKDNITVQRTASALSKPTRLDVQTAMRLQELSNASTISTSNGVGISLADEPPQRQRTLRHVRKHSALRDPLLSDQDSVKEQSDLNKSPRPPQTASTRRRLSDTVSRHGSCASAQSNRTTKSISSNRARREIWNSGAIPVVIVPERTSSHAHKSREPSLHSVSSRRSARTMSVMSAPLRDSQASFERQGRRSRRPSDLDNFDLTAFGTPPAIPPRSSSLSAPTSRDVSRASSIKSRSIKTNSIRAEERSRSQSCPVSPSPLEPECQPPQEIPLISLSPDLGEEPLFPDDREPKFTNAHDDLLGLEPFDETLSLRRLPSFDSPFYFLSMETCTTLPELSEALAVHMYQHQNTSILLVNNAGRSSIKQQSPEQSDTLKTFPTENKPTTPPLQKIKPQNAHSPLRNPRVPPQPPRGPPAFNSILATPSGKTSARERLVRQGNKESLGDRPPRQLDIVKRALNRRRHSVDYVSTTDKPRGFLMRTFSLSRNTRKEDEDKGDLDKRNAILPQADHTPAVEDELHASWQSQQPSQRQDDLEDNNWHGSYDSDFDEFVYPPVDNRPQRPTRRRRRRRSRSLSAAADSASPLPAWNYTTDGVLELESQNAFSATRGGDLESSRRRSVSLERSPRAPRREQTPSISRQTKGIWRSESVDNAGRMKRRFSVGEKFEEIQNIPQMFREKRREKKSQKLRLMISGPTKVRDEVGEVIRRGRADYHRSAMVTHI